MLIDKLKKLDLQPNKIDLSEGDDSDNLYDGAVKINDAFQKVEEKLAEVDTSANSLDNRVMNSEHNMIDLAIEVEILKNSALHGVDSNIIIETFQNLDDVNLVSGVYDSTRKLVKLV